MFNHSASKVNEANYCRRRYFLKNVLRYAPLLFSGYVRGDLMHDLIANFWSKLGKSEEIKRDKHGKVISEKKYSNAEEFLEHAQGQWLSKCIRHEEAGRTIEWMFEGEKWKGVYNTYLPQACMPLFYKILEEGSPIASELPFEFSSGDRKFTGRIDEVRVRDGQVVIRDYKTESPLDMEGMKLEGNPQLTIYCVGLCARCQVDEDLATRLGLRDERERFLGNPIYISSRVKPEFFMIETFRILKRRGEVAKKDPKSKMLEWPAPQLIYPTTREDKDFFEVLLFVRDLEEQVQRFLTGETKNIPPTERGKKCKGCDMKIGCKEELEKELERTEEQGGLLKDKYGQTYLGFASTYLIERQAKRTSRKFKQKRFRWKKS